VNRERGLGDTQRRNRQKDQAKKWLFHKWEPVRNLASGP
jgi:hypothetical protein